MKNNTLVSLTLLACMLILNSCNNNLLLDKQLRINFPSFHWVHNDTGWQDSESIWNLNNFNIDNYSKIDSVVLHAHIGNSSEDTCYLMLYNVTDEVDIENSMIMSTSGDPELRISLDFLDELPKKDIELGLKMKFATKGYAECSNPVLVLYR
jgi:cobalamin biosynthesis Co2+ chelatase CbiK